MPMFSAICAVSVNSPQKARATIIENRTTLPVYVCGMMYDKPIDEHSAQTICFVAIAPGQVADLRNYLSCSDGYADVCLHSQSMINEIVYIETEGATSFSWQNEPGHYWNAGRAQGGLVNHGAAQMSPVGLSGNIHVQTGKYTGHGSPQLDDVDRHIAEVGKAIHDSINKCTCGADKCGGGKHSSWCDKKEKYNDETR